MRRARCPHCKGTGGAMYYFTGDEGVPGTGGLQPASCHLCGGDGRLSPLATYLLGAGRALRRYRERRGISAYDLAKELDIEPGDVQNMEKGNFSLAVVVRGYTRKDREAIDAILKIDLSRSSKDQDEQPDHPARGP